MAVIQWGPWENSGGNGMRVGIEVNVQQAIGHNAPDCWISAQYFTQNEHSWGDDQSLNLGGAVGGSIGYRNSQGDNVISKRGERTINYDYGPNEYKTNAQRSFSATVNGAYNGITPSKTVTVNIPDRPFARPNPVVSPSVVRVSDETNQVRWDNKPTAGEPYDSVHVDRYTYGYGGYAGVGWTRAANLGATVEAWNDSGATPNRKYTYQIIPFNSVGYALDPGGDYAHRQTGAIYTAPATPTACVRTQVDVTHQRINWNSNVNYAEHQTQVFECVNGVWNNTPIHTAGAADGAQSYTHTIDATKKYKYRVRAKTSVGTALYSSYSGETTESSGTTSPPNPPTNLAPTANSVQDGTEPIVLSWKHNATDGKGQVKYEVQHREVGSGTWTSTGEKTATTASHTLAPTYSHSKSVEWQVRTWGTDASPSDWSATATFLTAPLVPVKYPVYLDLTSGRMEAVSSLAATSERPTASFAFASQAPTPTTGWARMTGGSAVIAKAGWYMVWGIARYNTGTGTAARRGAALSRANPAPAAPDINVETTITTANALGGSITVAGMAYCNVGDTICLWRYTDVAGHYAAAGGYVEAVWIGDLIGATGTGTGGGAVKVQDEGVEKVAVASALDFQGAGVTVTDGGSGKALVTIPGGAGGAGPMPTWEAVCTAQVEVTNTTLPITGCTVTVPSTGPTDKFLIVGAAECIWVAGNGLCQGQLFVDGVVVPGAILAQASSSYARNTTHQNWVVAGLAPGNHTFEMRGVTGAATTWRFNPTNTRFTVVKLEGPIGPAGSLSSGGTMPAYRAVPNANVVLSTTHGAVPGCSVVVPDISGPNEQILVTLAADFQWISGDATGAALLTVDGVEYEAKNAVMQASAGSVRATAHQNYLVTGLSPGSHTFGLNAYKLGTGAMTLYLNQTAMTAIRLVSAQGDIDTALTATTSSTTVTGTTPTLLTGSQSTLNVTSPTEKFLVTVVADMLWVAVTGYGYCELWVDGVARAPGRVVAGNNNAASVRSTGIMQHVLTGLSPGSHTLELRGLTSGATTSWQYVGDNTRYTVVRLSGGGGGRATLDDFSSASAVNVVHNTFTNIGGFAREGADPGFLTTDGTTFTFLQAGLYNLSASITYGTGTTASSFTNLRRIVQLRLNGVDLRRTDIAIGTTGTVEVGHTVRVNVGDAVTVVGWHNNGTNVPLGPSPGHRVQFTKLA